MERVLAGLEARGLLNEARFVEQHVAARTGRGQGPRRIREELRRRGIDDATARDAVARDDAYWCEQAARARSKRFGDATPADYRAWVRQARFLEGRGFTMEQIRSALGPPPRRR